MNANAVVSLPAINQAKAAPVFSAQTKRELKAALFGIGLWVVYIGTVHTAHLIARLTGVALDAHNVNIGATFVAVVAAGLLYLGRRAAR